MPISLAKRIISIVLIAAGTDSGIVTQLTGSCERSIRVWKSQMANGETDGLFEIGGGRGRKSKFADTRPLVLAELKSGNYQTLRQIADMVHDRFGVEVSPMAVCRLLKKTGSAS